MKELINDFGLMGVKAVTLSGGGEPLLYPHLVDLVKLLSEKQIKIAVLTNGSLLKAETAEVLMQEASWVRVSMDAADSGVYSKIRGVNGDEFNKACSNMENFAKNKKRKSLLGVNFIVMEENYRDVYKFLKLMKNIGVDHVKISDSIVSTKRKENKKYHSFLINSVKAEIKKGKVDLCEDCFSIIDKTGEFNQDENCYKKEYNRCLFIQCLTVIGADMNLYSCQDKAYTKKGKLGSIKNQSFRKLWFSENTKNKMNELNPSRDCNHHCTQDSKNMMLLDYIKLDNQHLDFV
jgi:MoaA/NifB/PqqE/SkfB family radical SAM enzyme